MPSASSCYWIPTMTAKSIRMRSLIMSRLSRPKFEEARWLPLQEQAKVQASREVANAAAEATAAHGAIIEAAPAEAISAVSEVMTRHGPAASACSQFPSQ